MLGREPGKRLPPCHACIQTQSVGTSQLQLSPVPPLLGPLSLLRSNDLMSVDFRIELMLVYQDSGLHTRSCVLMGDLMKILWPFVSCIFLTIIFIWLQRFRPWVQLCHPLSNPTSLKTLQQQKHEKKITSPTNVITYKTCHALFLRPCRAYHHILIFLLQ